MLVSFGYSSLPFWPQGKPYEAFFTDAGGITPGNDVNMSGIKVGKVIDVALAGEVAKVTFTVDRKVRVGDQSLVAIRTDTVLGQKSLAVTPEGGAPRRRFRWAAPRLRTRLNTALQDLGQNAERARQAEVRAGAADADRPLRDATPELRGTLDGVATLSRSINASDEALGQLLTARSR